MNWNKLFAKFLIASLFWACSDSDKTAGGTTEDAGIIADLNVAGVTQKGPFVKGSAVTVQGIDCKTLKFTDEKFEGKVKSDKGDFEVKDVNLSSTCAVFEVTGAYLNEVTGKKTKDKLTLHALTDLKDRKNVNINVLTELEYERVMNLVTKEKMSFAEAKEQAEKEVLASFNIKGDVAGSFDDAENLNIFEKGDGNAALLAVSVMVQGDADVTALAKRLEKFADDFAEDGEWNDSKTKKEIAEWAATATESGKLDTIRKNVESMNGGDKVTAFETVLNSVVENVIPGGACTEPAECVPGSASSSSKKGASSSSVTSAGSVTSSSSRVILSSSEGSSDSKLSSSMKNVSSSSASIENPKTSYLNPNINYGEMTDSRDGQVYKTVKIGTQVWMAQNLNYKTEGSNCYHDQDTNCTKYGRIYDWSAAMDSVGTWSDDGKGCGHTTTCSPKFPVQGVCPTGWHLPTDAEWNDLVAAVGGKSVAGKELKSTSGWGSEGPGSDTFGFSVIPASFDSVGFRGFESMAMFWSSTEKADNCANSLSIDGVYAKDQLDGAEIACHYKNNRISIRCLKIEENKPSVTFDNLTDSRDGKIYKTVKIGSQIWMAENLNYEMTESFCYDDMDSNCTKYGRLYTWTAAMDACPTGWHLPSLMEYTSLVSYVGGASIAGKRLKSTSGWGENSNGSDDYGFTGISAGENQRIVFDTNEQGSYWGEGGYAYFWTSTLKYGNSAYYLQLLFGADYIRLTETDETGSYGMSVRCLKD